MTQPTEPAPAPVETRLVLVAPNGDYVTDPQTKRLMGVVLTNTPNANTAAPISLEVEQQCDMGHWHTTGRTPLPVYSGAVPAAAEPAPEVPEPPAG